MSPGKKNAPALTGAEFLSEVGLPEIAPILPQMGGAGKVAPAVAVSLQDQEPGASGDRASNADCTEQASAAMSNHGVAAPKCKAQVHVCSCGVPTIVVGNSREFALARNPLMLLDDMMNAIIALTVPLRQLRGDDPSSRRHISSAWRLICNSLPEVELVH